MARRRRIRVDHDPHVDGAQPVGAGQHRVEVDLRDLRNVGDQLRDRDQQVRERLAVDRRTAAHALEQLGGRDRVEHRERVGMRRRREPERDVFQQLDQHTAEPERDQLPEARVGDGADDHFLAAGDLPLHLHAGDRRPGVVRLRRRDDLRVRCARRLRVCHAGDDAAGIGLVQDLRRDDLHHDREADLGGEPRRLVGRRRERFFRDRDPVGVGDTFRFGRRERRASIFFRLFDDGTHRGRVPRGACRRRHQIAPASFSSFTLASS